MAEINVRSVLYPIITLVLFICVWQIISTFFVDPRLMPSFTSTLLDTPQYVLSGDLQRNMLVSLGRILIGFGIGTGAGTLLGLFMGRIYTLRLFVDPVIDLFRNLSPTAMIPLAIIWFGIGESPKYFIITWGVFFYVLIPTIGAVGSAPVVRIMAAQSLGAKKLQVFFRVVIPSALPVMLPTIRTALGSAFASLIAAELVAATSGIGFFIDQGRILFRTDRIFIGLAVLAVTGYLVDRAYRAITDKFLHSFSEGAASRW